MTQENRMYIAIDLKSFYASVECVERGLDPLSTNLVVADASRTKKTICLAASPSLKAYGIPGRPRLFEVEQRMKEVNARRRERAPGPVFTGESCDAGELESSPELLASYIIAPPRMALYIEYSTKIYHIYLKYVAPEDMHVYSIDEVFMDVTGYLELYGLTARELAAKIMREVAQDTGITATAGIGPNLYLCKVAMDIVAKRIEPDEDGARIAQLDEMAYRSLLWDHRPLTDFWRVGRGYARKLEEHGLMTMGDVARCSLGKSADYYNEGLLYRLFGVNAELLIDHAWGWEPCTIADVKAYKPASNSLCSGQVLPRPYEFEKAKLIVGEMADALALDLLEKGLAVSQIVLTVGYDTENLTNPEIRKRYRGPVTTDAYGRKIPKHAHGTICLEHSTSLSREIIHGALELYGRIVNKNLLVRRISITANHAVEESVAWEKDSFEQLDLFTDYEAREKREADLERERRLQKAVLDIKKKFGKNAILKGMSLEEGATAMEQNKRIGGHKA